MADVQGCGWHHLASAAWRVHAAHLSTTAHHHAAEGTQSNECWPDMNSDDAQQPDIPQHSHTNTPLYIWVYQIWHDTHTHTHTHNHFTALLDSVYDYPGQLAPIRYKKPSWCWHGRPYCPSRKTNQTKDRHTFRNWSGSCPGSWKTVPQSINLILTLSPSLIDF